MSIPVDYSFSVTKHIALLLLFLTLSVTVANKSVEKKDFLVCFLLDPLVELRITRLIWYLHIKTQLVIKVSKPSPSSHLGRSGT